MTKMDDEPTAYEIRVSNRIQLSALRGSDKEAFAKHLNDRDFYDRTCHIPFPYSEVDAESFLASSAKATAQYGHPVHFAIRDRYGKAIGGFGFHDLTRGHRAEIGYWLAKPYWGQGLMTDVIGAMCTFATAEWKLIRIMAHVFAFNEASARVLVKNGFELEGVLKKHYQKDGAFIDARLYALVQ